MSIEPVPVLASELHMMDSKDTGRIYRISISLPLGYNKSPDEGWPFHNTPEKWPVVYLLDANWYIGMVTDTVRYMSRCGVSTDAIIVGIGYAEASDPIEAYWESFVRRDQDLTPIRDEEVEKSMEANFKRPAPNGDAGNFLKFIQNELIPFVEKNYRANSARRVLVGHSYGGLFGLYSLFEAPNLFESMVIGSPTLIYGKRFAFEREEAFAKDHKQLPVRIYLFVGELEEGMDDTTMTDTLRLAAILQGRNYEGLTLVKKVFEDLNHCDVFASGYQAGLKFALKK
jgi:predicted alpha/beta superfamily hydrolase